VADVRSSRQGTETLWITQIDREEQLRDVVRIDGPRGTFSHLQRMDVDRPGQVVPGNCLIDLLDEVGDLVGDPITVTPETARRLLRDFFGMPEAVWNEVVVRSIYAGGRPSAPGGMREASARDAGRVVSLTCGGER
jgi:hypothetical protein